MNATSVSHSYVQKQQDTLWNDVSIQFRGNEVFCPMCEVLHENNTNCQRND